MSELPLEMEFLRAVLRHHLASGTTQENLALLRSAVNWQHVLWLGRQHGVLLILEDVLKAPDVAECCPPEIVAQFRALHEVSQLRSLSHARELCQVQELLDRRGVPAIMLDPWLAAHHPGGRPELIECGATLRCLVPAKDLARAQGMLSDAGHPAEPDPEKLIRAGSSPVRLEVGLGNGEAAPRLWQKSSRFALGGRKLGRLSIEHWLFRQTPHRLPPQNILLERAVEIVSFARQIAPDAWPDVLAEAAHFGLAGPLADGIAACHRTLDLGPPRGLAGPGASGGLRSAAIAVRDRPAAPKVSAPFLPTPLPIVVRMLELAETKSDDFVVDLGCGDGRITIQAAQRFGARGRGIDRDPARIAEALANATANGLGDRVKFECGDLFAADIADASVVTCYLLPQLQSPLREKLRREARPGTRIVSHEFIFPGWPPERTEIIRTGPLKVSQIYLWRMD